MLFFRRPFYGETLMACTGVQSYRFETNGCMQLELIQDPMNANESDARTLEKPELNSGGRDCSVDRCETESIIVFGEQPFCLQHFLTRCYEWLDQLDPAAHDRSIDPAENARIKAMVEECSNRALLVSLRCETLSNLDRSRLLDILLRASDLLYALRIPSNIPTWLPIYPSEAPKPQRQKGLSLGTQFHPNKSFGV